MEKASKIIKRTRVFASKNLDGAASAALVCNKASKAFCEVFDKDFCKNTEVTSFKEGSLYVKVSSPTYAQEIKMKEGDIIGMINRLLEKKLVEKIRFRSGI